MRVVTRFAPSPTGYLHIGGARTALFNWLFARRHGGRFLLRIEDTDRARSTEGAIAAILDGIDWLGVAPDEAPLFQFARAPRHREAAEAMVARGTAFRCYVPLETLNAQREAARALQERARDKELPDTERAKLKAEAEAALAPFRSPYRDGAPPPSSHAPFVIRLRAPDAGEIVNHDLVQGDVRIAARDIDDLVLLRADATPTYMLAVVVDDHDMGVTHVIRGDDHLTNAARQIPIFAAMGWTAPQFAHIPLIHGQDGAKLSKRHGAAAVQEYRELGYLPEALCAYLVRLGWSPGDDDRILSKEDAAPLFDLARVQRSPARLDLEKLGSVNAHFLKAADDARLAALLEAHGASDKGWTMDVCKRERLRAATPILKARAKTLLEMAEQARFLVTDRPITLDAAAQKVINDDVLIRLRRLKDVLNAAPNWSQDGLAALLKDFAGAEGVGMGQIGPGLRAALTGGAPSPDLALTLALLGREESLARIGDRI
jgi:glutamyl-tRNA synthetase